MRSAVEAMAGNRFWFSAGPAPVGLVIHMMTGAMFGIGSAFLARRLRRAVLVGAGVVHGLAVCFLSAFVGLPLAARITGSGSTIWETVSMVGWATFAVEHMMFGLVLGRSRVADRTGRRRGRCRRGCPIGDAVAMSSSDAAPSERIVRLVGVYDADGTVRGEVVYWVGARLGRRHCSLCEITHGSVRQRPEWKACRAGLPVPFDTFHRDDQPDDIRAAVDGHAPVVVAETDTRRVVLLSPDDLAACEGSIDRLVEAIERSADRLGLSWAAR